MNLTTPTTTVAPVAQASYSSGQALPAPGTPEYAAAQNMARTAAAPRVAPATGADLTVGTSGPSTAADQAQIQENLDKSQEQSKQISDAESLASSTQAKVDSINASFAPQIAAQTKLNATNDARAYTLNSSNGLTNSGTGIGAESDEEAKGATSIQNILNSKTAAISTALSQADTLRTNQQAAELAQQQKDDATYQNLVTQNKKDATTALTALAKSGVSLNNLQTKEPDVYNSIKKEYGLSDIEMATLYGTLTPTQTKMSYKVTGNTIIGYGQDANGQMIVQTEPMPAGYDSTVWTPVTTTDGTMLLHNTQTGDYKAFPKTSTSAAKTTKYTQAQQSAAMKWLSAQPGYDYNSDIQAFNSDPAFQAWAVSHAEASSTPTTSKSGSSGTANPFSS